MDSIAIVANGGNDTVEPLVIQVIVPNVDFQFLGDAPYQIKSRIEERKLVFVPSKLVPVGVSTITSIFTH